MIGFFWFCVRQGWLRENPTATMFRVIAIRLFRDRARVEIHYVLHNSGRSGFPSLGLQLEDVKHQEIKDHAISADDKPVAVATESGDTAPFKRLYDASSA